MGDISSSSRNLTGHIESLLKDIKMQNSVGGVDKQSSGSLEPSDKQAQTSCASAPGLSSSMTDTSSRALGFTPSRILDYSGFLENSDFDLGDSAEQWGKKIKELANETNNVNNNNINDLLQDGKKNIVVAACPANKNHKENLGKLLDAIISIRGNVDGLQVHSESARAAASADVLVEYFTKKSDENPRGSDVFDLRKDPAVDTESVKSQADAIKCDADYYAQVAENKDVGYDNMVADIRRSLTFAVRKDTVEALLYSAKNDSEIRENILSRALVRSAKEQTGGLSAKVVKSAINQLTNEFAVRLEAFAKEKGTGVHEIGRTSILLAHAMDVLENRFEAAGLTFQKNSALQSGTQYFNAKKVDGKSFNDLKSTAAALLNLEQLGSETKKPAKIKADKRTFTATAEVEKAEKNAREKITKENDAALTEYSGLDKKIRDNHKSANAYVDAMLGAIADTRELDYVLGQEESFRSVANSAENGVLYFYMDPKDVYMFVPEDASSNTSVAHWDADLNQDNRVKQ